MNRILTQLDETHAVFQPESGFRFGIDALLLAGAVRCEQNEVGCELGTGCGVIPVLLKKRRDFARIYAIEIDPDMASLARENVRRNGMTDSVRVIEGDLKDARKLLPEACDFVFANPPYRKADEGGKPSSARHELLCTISEVCRAAGEILVHNGRFTVIWPAKRLTDLMVALRDAGVEPKEMIPVVPLRGGGAKFVIVTAKKGAKPGLAVSPAFVLRERDGGETGACRVLYERGVLTEEEG